MGAWEDQPAGVQKLNDLSAQPCGCDPRCNWKCDWHTVAEDIAYSGVDPNPFAITTRGDFTTRGPEPTLYDGRPLTGIKDSGKRIQFASGSMRDPSEGKIKWSRITFGPMMRRWADHLTRAEVKYPDPKPGIPNFMLIETEEELIRYKESAFRHFMAWFMGETDEDHAAACFFNINGVEIIREKRSTEVA